MLKKLLKIFLIFLLIIVVAITLAYMFISPIARYVIEKNSISWTGRRITVGSVNISAFSGIVDIKDLKIYEASDTSVFFSCHDIYLKVGIKKILNSNYQVDSISINGPEITITQNGNHFNFDDLLKRFLPGPDKQPDNSPQAHYDVNNVIISNGNITYNNVPVHNIIRVHNINFKLPEISSEKPESKLHLDFKYGTGGLFNIDLYANRKTFDYNLSLDVDKYDLSQYYAPLNTYIKISSLTGELNTKLRIHGKYNSPKEFSLAGYLHINDFEIKDMASRKTFALEKLAIDVDSINVKQNMYIFHNISFDRPYFVFDEFAKGNNISEMVKHREAPVAVDTSKGKSKTDYSNIFTLLSSSAKNMVTDFLSANYHADIIAIRNGQFVFNDYSEHKFRYNISKFNFVTDEVGAKNKRVIFHAWANLNDSGKFIMRANLSYDFKHKLFSYNFDTLKITDLSPFAKYLLEKNSVKWTGRRITTGKIKLNAVKGSIYIKDIKIYEPDSVSTFFACHDVYFRLNMKQMFNNTYHIEKIKIDNPEINIAQNGNHFNFEDMVKHFSSGQQQQVDTEKGPEIHYYVDSVLINHGDITYTNVPIHNTYKIQNLNFRLPQISWDNPVSKVHLDFVYGTGGLFNIDLNANRNTLDYDLALSVNNFDLSQYYAALYTFINISSLKGILNADLSLHGKLNSPKNVSGTGYLSINDFEITDSAKQKLFAMGQMTVDIDTVNVKQSIYSVNNIVMDRPFMRFDYFTKGNNITQMIKYTSPVTPVTDTATGQIKPDYSNIFTLLSSSVKMMAVDFVNTNYHTDSISIHNGQFIYNDYTLNNPFHYNITNLNISTDAINAKTKSIQFNISATLSDTGKLHMFADISLDMKNMLLRYDVANLRVADFNPYSEYYVGTPFLYGYMNYKSIDSVINRNLISSNLIHVEGLEVGEKEGKPLYNMPIHMAVSLLKDGRGNIDLKIPANGNLDDPNYKIGPLLGRILSDVVVKTAESPFKHLAKLFNRNEEEMKRFNFEYMQDDLDNKQERKLDDVYKVLDAKKELRVEITQVIDSIEEKDELALYLAKKQYYEATNHIVNDSTLSRRERKKEDRAQDQITTQDSAFDKFLNDKLQLPAYQLISIQDRCIKLIGDNLLSREVRRLIAARNQAVIDFLVKRKSIAPERVKVITNKDSLLLSHTPEPEFDIKYKAIGDKE